jgi:type IV pilus assembly protein PilM
MFKWLFKDINKPHSRLGIDLGNSAIKIVELAKKGARVQLLNYAIAQSDEKILGLSDLKDDEIGAILKNLMAQTKFESRSANISLPVEKTFTTVIDMPIMEEEEMVAAIPYEAQKYVPVPIEEVVLDWTLIPSAPPQKPAGEGGETQSQSEPETAPKTTVQLLVVAVPKDIIDYLTRIAKFAGLEVSALEQEAFSLSRSLIGADSGSYLIADFGSKNIDLVVVDQGLTRISHSLGLTSKEIILMEMDRIVNLYQMRYNKRVGQCLLTGGRAAEQETIKFLEAKLKLPIKFGNPLARVDHAPALDKIAAELGLQLAVAIGLAMRE